MKVCLVSQEYPPETGGGGIGTQTYLKAQGLSARGHHVEVVSVSRDTTPRTYQDGGALIHRVGEPDLGDLGANQATYWMALSMALARKLADREKQTRFDIMQFPEYCGEGFIYQTDNFEYRTAKYVVQLHGPLAMFAEHMGWPDKGSTLHQIGCFMERMVIHHSDLVLASSHNTASFCSTFYDYPVDRIRVIHSGIDTNRFVPRPRPSSETFPHILFVGNLVGSKGFNLLVDTVIRMRGEFPRIHLQAIGKGDADELRRVKQRVEDAGATDNIEVVGYVPYADLPSHYAWADIFAGPSVYEPGPGNIYLEAMSCGRPVIACNTAGAPEVVLDGKTGLLIPPGDSPALEQAIGGLAGDKGFRTSLGANGRDWVESEFSIDKYLDKVERNYEAVLNGRSS